jgi:hypothetical protein
MKRICLSVNSSNDSSSVETSQIVYAKQIIVQVHNVVGARKQTRVDYQSTVQVSGPAAWNLESRSEQRAEHRRDRDYRPDYDIKRQLP